jgi:hypothetical protein
MALQLHNLLLRIMQSQLDTILPQTGDAESKMRRNLGLDGATSNGSAPLSANDPARAARQALRSQVTAREYTERQLAQAQGAIQDMRTRLRHVHQEREAAVAAAHSAITAKDNAERNMRAAEAASATERGNRGRVEGMLRDAEVTIRDLREKLAVAHQTIHGMQTEVAAERQVRQTENDAVMVVPEVAAPEIAVAAVQDVIAQIVRRPVGRPRKTAVVEAGQASTLPKTQPVASPEVEAPSNRNAAAPAVRRPVGRPRKAATVQPVEKSITPTNKPQVSGKSDTKKASNRTDDQEPVQWWVEGWKGR